MDLRSYRRYGGEAGAMSTKIGVIAEGPIDHLLLPALLSRIAAEKADFTWPLHSEDAADLFAIRKRGHGGVLETVRRLVKVLDTAYFEHACFVILLDRRTKGVQDRIRKLIQGRDRFVLGIAIEEIEAWWLGDRRNTLAWANFDGTPLPSCRYAVQDYHAESDDRPKLTLDELTRLSERFDRCYGEGNVDLAREFAEDYWRSNAQLDQMAGQCPRGFGVFQSEVSACFRRIKTAQGLLFG